MPAARGIPASTPFAPMNLMYKLHASSHHPPPPSHPSHPCTPPRGCHTLRTPEPDVSCPPHKLPTPNPTPSPQPPPNTSLCCRSGQYFGSCCQGDCHGVSVPQAPTNLTYPASNLWSQEPSATAPFLVFDPSAACCLPHFPPRGVITSNPLFPHGSNLSCNICAVKEFKKYSISTSVLETA